MALLMSLILGSGLAALTSNPALAQSYGYQDDYSYNNNSYSDSSYGGDSYSSYPTDDKPYECQKGPLEGFFTSSVEFCKNVKFDDRKDHSSDNNNTGTQGPQGPQGPAGQQGPQGNPGSAGVGTPGPTGPRGFDGTDGVDGTDGAQGPRGFNGTDGVDGTDGTDGIDGRNGIDGTNGTDGTDGTDGIDGRNGIDGTNGTDGARGPEGPSVLNNTRFYVDLGNPDTTNPLTSTASCDTGDSATGGGFIRVGNTVVNTSGPDAGGNSWTVAGTSTGSGFSLQATAQCFDNSPLPP